jgi:hypothetical protein
MNPMPWAVSERPRYYALRVAISACFFVGCTNACFAQAEPPLTIPATGKLPGAPSTAIPLEGWLLFPSLRTYSLYSDNLFQSSTARISALGFGTTPSLTAQWTNGIHTTTLFGNIDRQVYPTDNAINTFDREATATQTYSPLPDLTFTAQGDYTHKTIQSSLTNSIPNSIVTPTVGPTVLPNGNTQLPNGTIVSPTGQVVSQANPGLTVNGTSVINPYDQFTGTTSVSKIFNRGILTLSTSMARTDYQNPGTPGFTQKSFTENGAVWLGPLIYGYSNGSFAMTSNTSPNPNSTAYRVVGGIGTRQFGLFRGSAYFGHQGSEIQAGGQAGGEVYGGAISYYPTPLWTLTAAIDETVNISSETSVSTQALAIPAQTPLQIPLSSSTRITATSLHTTYTISRQWSTSGSLSYTKVQYLNSSRLDNSWLAEATLSYDIWRNMTLAWDYQYATIVSNVPFMSSKRNYINISATYNF